MKLFLILSTLLSSSMALAGVIKCDLGDNWVENLSSAKEVIECDTFGVGNGVCYEGNPYKVAHQYFKKGDEVSLEEVGSLEITTVYVRKKVIRVSYVDQDKEKTRLYIEPCK